MSALLLFRFNGSWDPGGADEVPACADGSCIVLPGMVPFQIEGRTGFEPVSPGSCARRIAVGSVAFRSAQVLSLVLAGHRSIQALRAQSPIPQVALFLYPRTHLGVPDRSGDCLKDGACARRTPYHQGCVRHLESLYPQ